MASIHSLSSSSDDDADGEVAEVVFVVVKGLRTEDSGPKLRGGLSRRYSSRYNCYYFPEAYHLDEETYNISDIVLLDSGFNDSDDVLKPGILSPAWFEKRARALLDELRRLADAGTGRRLVVFGENLGGVVVKRALTIADSDQSFRTVSRATCACVLFGVPHKAPSLQEWGHLITATVIPFWQFLPDALRNLTQSSLPGYLARTSSDFTAVAFGRTIVSVCQSSSPREGRRPAIIDESCGVLDVSHEQVMVRNVPLSEIAVFEAGGEPAERLLRIIKDGVSVAPGARDYIRALSRLSPYTPLLWHAGARTVLDAIEDSLLKLPRDRRASAVVLYGDRRVGKSTLAYALFESLLRDESTDHCAYFAFNARDHRRLSVSSMLASTISQLLSDDPTAADEFLSQGPDHPERWTEAQLWMQLSAVIRKMQGSSIHLVIDSAHDCETDNRQEFLRRLFHLRLVAPGRLTIWCTSAPEVRVSSIEGEEGGFSVDVGAMSEFRSCLADFRRVLAETLASENPKLMAAKAHVEKCLDAAEGFSHANLIAYRIRGISSLSRLDRLSADLGEFGTGWKETVRAMLHGIRPWAASAVSWMLFARRPLKSAELAAAMSLGEMAPDLEYLERSIPYDIEGDVSRQLGPLVKIELGEIRIAHSYVAGMLQEWVKTPSVDGWLSSRTSTTLLLEYLHLCLGTIGESETVPSGRAFSLLGYALEHWHVHYRKEMGDFLQPTSLADHNLRQLASSLLAVPERLHWLASAGSLSAEVIQPGSNHNSPLRPVMLAARWGLYDIFTQLLDLNSHEDRLDALRIACQNNHLAIVEYLVRTIDGSGVMESLLFEVCERGDERVAGVLIDRLRTTAELRKEMPARLLLTACSIGHMSLAEMLIGAGVSANAHSVDRTTPLHAAIHHGHLDVVNLLLRHGADVNYASERGWTPLQCSINRGYPHISNRLLREAGLVDDMNKDHLTSAHLAARLGDVELLKQVIDLPRPNTDIQDFSHLLHEAAAYGHLEAVKLLLNRTTSIDDPDSEGRTALFLALAHNRVDVVDYLLKNGAAVDSPGAAYSESVLKQAIIHGNLAATTVILQKGGDPNGGAGADSSPLTDAAKADHADIVRALLDKEVDLYQRVENDEADEILDEDASSGWTAIHFAAYYGGVQVMRLLLDIVLRENPEGVDARTASGHTPLHLAVFRENVAIVKMLLADVEGPRGHVQAGSRSAGPSSVSSTRAAGSQTAAHQQLEVRANVNATTNLDRTPLHIATLNATSGLTELLLTHGASPRACDNKGRTPLHLAALRASPLGREKGIVSALLSRGADPGAPDAEQMTPLHYAARAGSTATTLLLVQAGSPVVAVDSDGLTPLDHAAREGFADVLAQLLQYGADPNVTDRGGYTPLHAAAFGGHDDVVDLLLRAGASPSAASDRGSTPLHEAARRGHDGIVRQLVDAGAHLNPVDSLGNTPLQRAVLNRWTSAATVLLRAGADPNIPDENGDTALTAALLSDENDIAEALLEQDEKSGLKLGPDLDHKNGRGKTALMLAAGSPQMIKRLLDAGADAFVRDNDGRTFLHDIAAWMYWYSVQALVRPLADKILPVLVFHPRLKTAELLRLADYEGLTPAHVAARCGNAPVLKAFRIVSDDVMALKDRQGRTTMHNGVLSLGIDEFGQLFDGFLRPREDNKVNVPDADGWTPLHWACKGGKPDVVKLLLTGYKHPIRALRYPCARGWSAVDVAVFHRRDDILRTVEKCALAMDQEWRGGREPRPPASAQEAFRGRDDDDQSVASTTERAPSWWKAAVRSGLRSDGKRVWPGAAHMHVACDDCQCLPIHGIRFRCRDHDDFDLCFKCYWHREETHYPPGHQFDAIGHGPTIGPLLVDAPGPHQRVQQQQQQQRTSSELRRSYSSNDLDRELHHSSFPRRSRRKSGWSRASQLSQHLAGEAQTGDESPAGAQQTPPPEPLSLSAFLPTTDRPDGMDTDDDSQFVVLRVVDSAARGSDGLEAAPSGVLLA